MSIRVVVADDQDLVRTGLVMILGAQPGIDVVGEAADGIQAIEVATRLRPDVLLVTGAPTSSGSRSTRWRSAGGITGSCASTARPSSRQPTSPPSPCKVGGAR